MAEEKQQQIKQARPPSRLAAVATASHNALAGASEAYGQMLAALLEEGERKISLLEAALAQSETAGRELRAKLATRETGKPVLGVKDYWLLETSAGARLDEAVERLARGGREGLRRRDGESDMPLRNRVEEQFTLPPWETSS